MRTDDEAKLMAKEICQFIHGRCDKKELSLLKDKPDQNGRGGINYRLEKLAGNLLGKTNEQLVVITKSKKEKGQTPLEFQRIKYQQYLSLLDDFKLDNQLAETILEYHETLQVLKQEHKPNVWLNDWADKAKDISFATHVAKLTHSSSKSISVYDRSASIKLGYLTTSSIKSLMIDTATANAASAPAGDILTLEVNNKTLLDFIKENNPAPFKELTVNELEIESWMNSFKQAYEKDRKNSHFLSKQVYFPINEDKYHLLLPLVSSSMAHALHLRFQEFFDDDSRQASEQRKNNKYHVNFVVSFPNRATLKVPGKPQTASILNQERRGLLTLLPAMPPKWTGKQTLPLHQTSLFDRNMGYKLREEIKELQDLLRVIKVKEVGLKKPEMYRAIIKNVNLIVQALFDEITKINLLSEQKGWTVNSDFPIHQQLLLEPEREDEAALAEKINKQWLERIADDFSAWLNAQLKHKTLNLTPVQQRLWKDIFSPVLREYIAIQEAK
nr:type I-F CRISPR-associated protein Csy1 [Nitrosomonas nitrosa]